MRSVWRKAASKTAFSLIELVIVVVIIAIIGAVAIPRLSRGATGAAESALVGDLETLRKAIDLYGTEHGGVLPTGSNIATQLLQYTDVSGNTSATPSTTFLYGPYLRALPALPVGGQKGSTTIMASGTPASSTGAAGYGWVYNPADGTIISNTLSTEVDSKGIPYLMY